MSFFAPPGYSILVRLTNFDESANVSVKAWTEIDGKFQPLEGGLVAAGQEPRDADIIIPVGRTMLHFISVETDASSDSGDDNFIQLGLIQSTVPGSDFDILLQTGRLIPEKNFTWPDSWNCPCVSEITPAPAVITSTAPTVAFPNVTFTTPANSIADVQNWVVEYNAVAAGATRILQVQIDIGAGFWPIHETPTGAIANNITTFFIAPNGIGPALSGGLVEPLPIPRVVLPSLFRLRILSTNPTGGDAFVSSNVYWQDLS
jgi:hypothetical protein